jgi:hypothetical protein
MTFYLLIVHFFNNRDDGKNMLEIFREWVFFIGKLGEFG